MNKNLLDWINAASGVATFGTLVFVLVKEYRTRKQVQDLTVVANELAEQNQLQRESNQLQKKMMGHQVRPDIVSGGAGTSGSDGKLWVRILNNSNQAVITNIEFKEDFVNFTKKNTPILFKAGSRIKFEGVSNGQKHITQAPWSINVQYEDVFQNKYLMTLIGTGDQFRTGFVTIDTFEISEDQDKE